MPPPKTNNVNMKMQHTDLGDREYMHSSQFQISARAKGANLLISYQYLKPFQNIKKYKVLVFILV